MKKYAAMENAVCAQTDRAHGMFAVSTGPTVPAGIVRAADSVAKSAPEPHGAIWLTGAGALVRSGNYEALSLLYEDIPDTLSQLIRTAFVPQEGRKFIVADFSAIEAQGDRLVCRGAVAAQGL